jgi:succinate dehydrogenase/fumarate reductase flavoprotein subunit
MTSQLQPSSHNVSPDFPSSWDLETDVVVVGYGYAGGVASIEARDAGAEVLLLEKMPQPGGISICSGGGVRTTTNVESAFAYLKESCGGLTPDPVLRAFAEGMLEAEAYMEELAKINGAEITHIDYPGNYPFPGFRDLGFSMFGSIPGFDPIQHYPHVRGLRGGARHFRIIEQNVERRGVRVLTGTSVQRLITTPDGRVAGVWARQGSQRCAIRARRGVVLACGGFEAAEDLKRQFLQGQPFLSAAYLGNTGDGIRMAQDVGAALWHMWNVHGTYGFRHPDPSYPYGLRTWRLPDWNPEIPILPEADMAWIVVDRSGRRYMDEYPPYFHDTGHRPMQVFDEAAQRYPRIPSYLIFDDEGRQLYPMAMPAFNDPEVSLDWSEDNLAEVDLGILQRAETVAEIAQRMGLESEVLEETVDRWNRYCDRGQDLDFGRRPETMRPIRTPPFFVGQVWPVLSNTQGGPMHDEGWRVLDPFGQSIPGLWEAGELGGIFGHLYLAGGNLAECYIGGWHAGRGAAANEAW